MPHTCSRTTRALRVRTHCLTARSGVNWWLSDRGHSHLRVAPRQRLSKAVVQRPSHFCAVQGSSNSQSLELLGWQRLVKNIILWQPPASSPPQPNPASYPFPCTGILYSWLHFTICIPENPSCTRQPFIQFITLWAIDVGWAQLGWLTSASPGHHPPAGLLGLFTCSRGSWKGFQEGK